MMAASTRSFAVLLLLCSAPCIASDLPSTPVEINLGESAATFPTWEERVLLEWTNRARSAPDVDLAGCGANCSEPAGCYVPMPPLYYNEKLTHSARFHSDELRLQGYFGHNSICTVVSDINTKYPATCDGSAACACVGGTLACNPACTAWDARVQLFGGTASAENIAFAGNPNTAFYTWLLEAYGGGTCSWTQQNGHRYTILKSTGAVGYGVSSTMHTGDYGSGGTASKIPSAIHYPKQAASVDFWANWYDTAGPKSATLNVDGTCSPMAMDRGTATNGVWKATRTGLGTGCHRYYFTFVDSTDAIVRYPTTGSLAVGPSDGTCPIWDSASPSACIPLRGDANGDGVVTTSDAVWLINHVFAGGAPPVGNGDANGDNSTNAADVFYLINYFFAGGPPPPA